MLIRRNIIGAVVALLSFCSSISSGQNFTERQSVGPVMTVLLWNADFWLGLVCGPYPWSGTGVQYYLYTKDNPGKSNQLFVGKSDSFNSLDVKKPVLMIIHGYRGSADSLAAIGNLRNNLLTSVDANVVFVDWRNMAWDFTYLCAEHRTWGVAKHVAKMIDYMTSKINVPITNLHLIGYNMGAHVAGRTNWYLKSGKPGRITGLDPMGPVFRYLSADRRLDASDADFVDIIHTNGGHHRDCRYGLLDRIGHVDFYPNGGQDQPGCSETGTRRERCRNRDCSKQRSVELFSESVVNSKAFESKPCDNYGNFQQGLCKSCGTGCNNLGYSASPKRHGKFYLNTKGSPPYNIDEANSKSDVSERSGINGTSDSTPESREFTSAGISLSERIIGLLSDVLTSTDL